MTDGAPPRPPRKPKGRDYTRVAVAAARASLEAQTAAHVAVLQAADHVTTAEETVAAAQAALAGTVTTHARAVAAFVALVGVDEAATRLDLEAREVRALTRQAAPSPPATAATAPPQSRPLGHDGTPA